MASHGTLHENCMVGTALAPVAVTSSALTPAGTSINVATLGGQRISFIANCANIVSADTITFTFEESADASSWTTIKNTEATSVTVKFEAKDGNDLDSKSSMMTIPYSVLASTTKYVRIVTTGTSTGTFTSTIVGVSYVSTGHNTVPTAQSDLTYNQCVSYA